LGVGLEGHSSLAENPIKSRRIGFQERWKVSQISSDSFDRQILDQIPDGLLIVDDLGGLVFLNSAARKIFGLDDAPMVGSPIVDLLPDWSDLQAHAVGREGWGLGSDGSRLELDVSTSLAHTDRGVLALASIRDVSGRKERESRDETDRDALRDEIRGLKAHEVYHDSELTEAAKVLESYLPPKDFRMKLLAVSWGFSPCQTLGGDMLRLHHLEEGCFLFSILDVSGHGLASALLSVSLARSLSKPLLSKNGLPKAPGAVLAQLNRSYQVFERVSQFVTLIHGVYDPKDNSVVYACAGHPHAFRFGRGKAVEVNGPINPPLGILPKLEFEETRLVLEPGEKLLFYTDGLTESKNPSGELYGEERLQVFLLDHMATPLRELPDLVLKELDDFRKRPAADDITTLFLEARSGPDAPAEP
jgi:PAS domain S-box-containing protein